MSQQTKNAPPRMNTLIPMEDEDGNRCFVNQWDVPARLQGGWKVVGKLEQHTSTTKAPVEHLEDADPAAGGAGGKPNGGKGKTGGKTGGGKTGATDGTTSDADPAAGGAGGDKPAK